jgi:hypothetical protein
MKIFCFSGLSCQLDRRDNHLPGLSRQSNRRDNQFLGLSRQPNRRDSPEIMVQMTVACRASYAGATNLSRHNVAPAMLARQTFRGPNIPL